MFDVIDKNKGRPPKPETLDRIIKNVTDELIMKK